MTLSEAEALHKKIMEMSVEEFDTWYEEAIAEYVGNYDEGFSSGYAQGYADGGSDYDHMHPRNP